MIFSAIGIGILLSLLFTELTGLLAGGLISAGYMAFFATQPARLGMTLLVVLLVYGVVRGLSRFIVLYGRRRFAAAVILSYVLGWFCAVATAEILPADMDVRAVGLIIPGLVANDMLRQGVAATLVALAAVAVLTRLFLELSITLNLL